LNILTKICVVVLLILVLVASVVFINMATVPPNYRQLYKAQKTKAALSDQETRTQKLLTNRLRHELGLLTSKNKDLVSELATLKVDAESDAVALGVDKLAQQINDLQAQRQKDSLTIEAMGKRNELLSGQLDELRKTGGEKDQQKATLAAKLTEIQGELQRSERVVRALEQQLRDRDERIADLENQLASPGAATAAAGAAAVSTQAKVNATISAVRGETASINVGAAQGVARGQKFYIYRKANFVGYLRIDEVDEGEAAGTVVDKQLDPVIGDKVSNDLMK